VTFYGESIGIDRRTNLVGSAVANVVDVQLRAGSATFTAGDSTRFASDLGYDYLSPGDPAVVSWVVEVLSGSGTFSFAEGIGNTATSLGSQAVTGPAQIVLASSAITAANVIADVDARLLVTCTSGTVVVQQVKLRVWPPEGVAGGWSDPYPSWSDEDPVNAARTDRFISADTSGAGSAAAEWAAVIALAQTAVDEPWASTVDPLISPLRIGHSFETVTINAIEGGGGTSSGSFSMSLAALRVSSNPGEGPQVDPSLGLVAGVDYIWPPDEVNFDSAAMIQGLGARSWEWTNVGVWLSGDTGTDGVALLAVDDAPTDLDFASWPDSSASPLAPGQNGLTMPPGEVAVFAESHSWLFDGPDFPGGSAAEEVPAGWGMAFGVGDPDGDAFAPLSVRVTFPPYRLWSPVAVPPAVLRKVRQFHRDTGDGVAPPRAFGGASRIRTGRAYGYD